MRLLVSWREVVRGRKQPLLPSESTWWTGSNHFHWTSEICLQRHSGLGLRRSGILLQLKARHSQWRQLERSGVSVDPPPPKKVKKHIIIALICVVKLIVTVGASVWTLPSSKWCEMYCIFEINMGLLSTADSSICILVSPRVGDDSMVDRNGRRSVRPPRFCWTDANDSSNAVKFFVICLPDRACWYTRIMWTHHACVKGHK